MNLESKLKTDLVAACRDLGAYARRLEDRYALGLLDLTIKFPGHPHLFAEAKVVAHQTFAPTLRQFLEGKRYIDAGGLACLIGFDKRTEIMFIHEWAETATKTASFPFYDWTNLPSEKGYGATLKEWLEWRMIK